jgi:sulfotransferase
MNTFCFVAGLPRSGSTLLLNICGQNPRFRVGSTSGIMDVMFGVRNQWDKLIEFKASPNPGGKIRVLRGIIESYYADSDHPVVFDKCRGWISTGMLEMIEEVLGRKAKILVPVRDLREVLASFEKLHRKNALTQSGQESQNYFLFQTVAGRCEVWMRPDQPIGLAVNRIRDALQRGFSDRMHFVHFSQLTRRPFETIAGIYAFLEEKPYCHDFQDVRQLTHEDDVVHGFTDLHTIRRRVEPVSPDFETVLGPVAGRYAGPYVWDDPILQAQQPIPVSSEVETNSK